MGLRKDIGRHERWCQASASDRPPPPVDPTNPTAADTIAMMKWQETAPRPLNQMGLQARGVKHFRGKDLRLAGLRGADLRETNFQKSDLRGADLRDTLLEGADFSKAVVDRSTRIGGADFGKGLANLASLEVLLVAVGGDPEETKMRALLAELQK